MLPSFSNFFFLFFFFILCIFVALRECLTVILNVTNVVVNECISDVCLLEVVKREKKEAEEEKKRKLNLPVFIKYNAWA